MQMRYDIPILINRCECVRADTARIIVATVSHSSDDPL